MANTLELVLGALGYGVQFLLVAFYKDPYTILSVLLAAFVTVSILKYVMFKAINSSVLGSPVVSLTLLLSLTAAFLKLSAINQQVLTLESALNAANQNIRLSQTHRLNMLNQINTLKIGQVEDVGDNHTEKVEKKASNNPLDGCLHVYLDLGTNRGVQIRKLYEPSLFPLAPIHATFNKYFGDAEYRDPADICSVGFEPNPAHEKHLKEMEEAYATCGIKAIMMKAGVGAKNKVSRFVPINTAWGTDLGHDVMGRFLDDEGNLGLKTEENNIDVQETVHDINIVRFSEFVLETVATRKLPLKAQVIDPKVVVKMDIEGMELEVIPDMYMTGAFRYVDNLHGEWHGYESEVNWEVIQKLEAAAGLLADLSVSQKLDHHFEVTALEDETYTGVKPDLAGEVPHAVPRC